MRNIRNVFKIFLDGKGDRLFRLGKVIAGEWYLSDMTKCEFKQFTKLVEEDLEGIR